MSNVPTPKVTPDKICFYLRKANPDQLEALYLLSHHVIRGCAPTDRVVPLDVFMDLLKEGSNRQLLLIIQAVFHIVQRKRMN